MFTLRYPSVYKRPWTSPVHSIQGLYLLYVTCQYINVHGPSPGHSIQGPYLLYVTCQYVNIHGPSPAHSIQARVGSSVFAERCRCILTGPALVAILNSKCWKSPGFCQLVTLVYRRNTTQIKWQRAVGCVLVAIATSVSIIYCKV